MRLLYSIIAVVCFCINVGCNSSEELLHPYTAKPNKLCGIDTALFVDNTGIESEEIDLKRPYKEPDYADYLQSKYASLMQVTPEAIRSLMLYTFIDNWYGVHYKMGGKDKKGIDCSAFAQKVYTYVFGIDLVRTSREQFTICRFVQEEEELMEGDLVFFRIKGKRISHVGIYLMNSFFVHSATNGGVMISSLNEPYWSKRFAGAGYIPKEKG